MMNSQSKFSNDKFKSGTNSNSASESSKSSCCCGSKLSEDFEEKETLDVNEQ